MRRRSVIALLGAAWVWARPLAALAQARTWRIGWLDPNPPPTAGRPYDNIDTFAKALAELGYVERRDYVIEARFADTDNSRLPALAKELIEAGVDMIVTIGTPTVAAAKGATATIPIVMAGSADPIEHGFVTSLRHPGGNITGVTHSPGPEFASKGLELLKEAAPGTARIAVLMDSSGVHEPLSLDAQQAVATRLGLTLLPHDVKDVRSAGDFDPIFAAIKHEGADALFIFPNFIDDKYAKAILDFAAASRLPSMSQETWLVEQGALISYYTNWLSLRRKAATYVDKIIKGAKPADLPVEEPSNFELVINLKTAKSLGLTIPQSLLLRADEVIE